MGNGELVGLIFHYSCGGFNLPTLLESGLLILTTPNGGNNHKVPEFRNLRTLP